jgi:hypothetical protein
MSLISSASPWISEEPQKKRAATLRKTIKKTLADNPIQSDEVSSIQIRDFDPPSNAMLSRYEDTSIESFANSNESIQNPQNNVGFDSNVTNERNQRVNEILQKMNSLNIDSDGKNLADFKPLSHPVVNQTPQYSTQFAQPIHEPTSSMRPIASANNYSLDKNSDYRVVYQPVNHANCNYLHSLQDRKHDDKLLDKINYMIHLLEEQSNEKTNNQLEEFVMFSLVGVFIIYVLDSFSRSGRYTR